MKTIVVNVVLILLATCIYADTFRLRLPAVVDRIGANGEVIGETTLPAGTIVSGEVKASEKGEKLVAGTMSPAMFRMMAPKDPVVLNAVVRMLSDLYPPNWASSKDLFFVEVQAYNQQWAGRCVFRGYFEKTGAVGTKLIPIIQDGAEHRVLLKIRYHDKDDLHVNVDVLDCEEIKFLSLF